MLTAAKKLLLFSGGSLPVGVAPTVAPILSNAVGQGLGGDAADLGVDTTGSAGTLYWVVTLSAVAPAPSQVAAGVDHLGVAAADSGSQAVVGAGAQSASASGLVEDTVYFVHFVHEGTAGFSNVATSAAFTTEAVAGVPDFVAVFMHHKTYGAPGSAPAWLEDFRAPSGELPGAAGVFVEREYWVNGQEVDEADYVVPIDGETLTFVVGGLYHDEVSDPNYPHAGLSLLACLTSLMHTSGLTGVITFIPVSGFPKNVFSFLEGPAFAVGLDLYWATGPTQKKADLQDYGTAVALTANQGTLDARNRVAWTYVPGGPLRVSQNGGVVATSGGTNAQVFTALTEFWIGCTDGTGAEIIIESVVFYSVQSDGDLPTLSTL